jgi:hypothetical protein
MRGTYLSISSVNIFLNVVQASSNVPTLKMPSQYLLPIFALMDSQSAVHPLCKNKSVGFNILLKGKNISKSNRTKQTSRLRAKNKQKKMVLAKAATLKDSLAIVGFNEDVGLRWLQAPLSLDANLVPANMQDVDEVILVVTSSVRIQVCSDITLCYLSN